MKMKWINLSLFIIWVFVIVLGTYWAWQGFNNAQTLTRGGYLYDNNGNVIGMWDGWDNAHYSIWLFPVWMFISLLTSNPIWWVIAFWGIGAWLVFYYVYPANNQEGI